MSIRTKLLLGFGLVLAVTGVGFIIMYLSLQYVGNSYKELSKQGIHKLTLAQDIQYEDLILADAIRGIIIEPNNDIELNRYNQYAEMITQHIEEAKQIMTTERSVKIFQELDEYNQTLIDLETQMMDLAGKDQVQTLVIYNGEYQKVREVFARNLEEFKRIQQQENAAVVQKDLKVIEFRSTLSLVAIIISSLIGVMIAIVISRQIMKPLLFVKTKLLELSHNEGDLTMRLQMKSKDEFGQLADAFNKMLENVQHLIQQVKHTTIEVATSSEQLHISSQQNTKATNEMTLAIQEIANSAEQQLKGTEEGLAAINEMTIGIQRIADSSSHVADFTDETMKQAEEGNQAVKRTIQQMTTIQQVVDEAGKKVEELGQISQEVGSIVEVITGIAEQTNLLALNASIEAARAGEAGKGFAVVADEVKKLAEQSKESAHMISTLILTIQTNTTNAVESTNLGIQEVENGLCVVNEVSQAFNCILESIRSVSEQIQEVSASSQQMSAGTEQMNASLAELSHFSKKSAANAQNIAQSAHQQQAVNEGISSSVAMLSKMASELEHLVERFKV